MIAALLSSPGHISVNPNYGAATGGYFAAKLKIPHGETGMHSVKFVLHVPRGVASARPSVPGGWTVNVTEYDLAEEDRYESHGHLVTKGPDKIIWTADSFEAALYTDHLMYLDLQLKLLCNFNDPVGDDYSGSNSIWQGQHTLWFKMEQHSSNNELTFEDTGFIDHAALWTGALKDNDDGTSPSWNPPSDTGLKACPYLFIYAGTRCSLDHSGEQVVGGMNWMGSYVEPVQNMDEVMHEQHVIDLATEAALTSQESLDGLFASVTTLDVHATSLTELTERVANKAAFAHTVSGLPVITNLPNLAVGSKGTTTAEMAPTQA
jgi:hypothetical protein